MTCVTTHSSMVQVHAKMAMVHWCNNDWRSYLAGLNSSAQLILAQPDGSMLGLMAGLTTGLKVTRSNSSADSCLLMAMDSLDNGGCCNGSTDGSTNCYRLCVWSCTQTQHLAHAGNIANLSCLQIGSTFQRKLDKK